MCARLLAGGWDVTAASRRGGPPSDHVRGLALDREREALPSGYDLVVDIVAYGPEHARQLLACDAGSAVVISSASVYADLQGRSLDEAGHDPDRFPHFSIPIGEDQPTVAAGDATYSTGKVALERTLLEQDRLAATLLRPCAIHGP